MKGKRVRIFLIIIIVLIAFLYFENNGLTTTRIDVVSENLPKGFNGYKIVQLSDFHSKEFGKNQSRIAKRIKKLEPDMIVVTGDLVDSRHYDEEKSVALMVQCVGIAPTYYVPGNHEFRSGKYGLLEKRLEDAGVIVLRNVVEQIAVGDEWINVIGIEDPSNTMALNDIEDTLNEAEEIKGFKILLSHRPELFSTYSDKKIDLIFSGHAHGGQVRLPLVGGLVAPNQGFFPEFTAGKHIDGSSIMVVSRGLGNSIIPQRVFNRPEIVVVTLGSLEK